MDIAVIIPLFNGEEWIGETLNAVRAQTRSPSEIVVVEDGSTDSSRCIGEEYSDMRLFENPGTGRMRPETMDSGRPAPTS